MSYEAPQLMQHMSAITEIQTNEISKMAGPQDSSHIKDATPAYADWED